jgi:hypothetical protein
MLWRDFSLSKHFKQYDANDEFRHRQQFPIANCHRDRESWLLLAGRSDEDILSAWAPFGLWPALD